MKIGGVSAAAIVALGILGCWMSVAVPVGVAVVALAQAGRVDAPLSACVEDGGLRGGLLPGRPAARPCGARR